MYVTIDPNSTSVKKKALGISEGELSDYIT